MSAAVKLNPGGVGRYDGGARFMNVSAIVGAIGVIGAIAMMFVGSPESRERAAHSYLFSFTFWTGIAVAAIILVAILHTMHAKWVTLLRRPLEVMGASIGLYAVLLIPLLFVLPGLYLWMHDADALHAAGTISEIQVHHLHLKQHGYLNLPFFLVRQVIYFGSWIAVSYFLLRWSRQQDADGSLDHTVRLRKLGPGAIPLLGMTLTFAGFDWLMSLTPLWQSTIFGVYYFAGSFLACIALWTLLTLQVQGPNGFGTFVSVEHDHNLGKLLLAFTAFWAYIGFSQFLLVWSANLPEEAPWYHVRIEGPWLPFSIALVVLHFLLPFAALLSSDLKRRPKLLRIVALYILIVHVLDSIWMVLPSRYPDHGYVPAAADLFAFVGIGGLGIAAILWILRRGYSLPVKDPYLADSLRYVQP